MPEFDLHASIKRLAENVRFAVLRVECSSLGWSLAFHVVQHDKAEDYPCCQGRGWVPEPDARVACWEVFKLLPNRIKRDIADAPFHLSATSPFFDTWEEAVLREAEVWLEEKL